LFVHQQVVGLVLKAPLADDQASTCTMQPQCTSSGNPTHTIFHNISRST
jgi:hypothetical protein